MSAFNTYLRLGYEHIVNPAALDHIVFIVALTAVYQPKSWLKIILAITFFTIGHSLTLTLSAFDLTPNDNKYLSWVILIILSVVFIINLIKAYQTRKGVKNAWTFFIVILAFISCIRWLFGTFNFMNLILNSKALIEFLIPVTIGITALFNLTKAGQDQKSKSKFWIAGVFGLIHGLGFANYYGMLTLGETKYWSALLPFNLGVELGQLLIVGIILLLMVIFQMMLNTKSQSWNLFFSGTAFGLAVLFCFQNWPF